MSKDSKKALVVGATGVVGREIVKQLCQNAQYEKVVAWLRRNGEFSHPKFEARVIDFEKIGEIESEKIDEIYCALGTTIKQAGSRENFLKVDVEYVKELAKWGKKAGVKNFVLISSPGADENSKIFYLKAKGEAQKAVREMNFKSLAIIHPPLINGERKDKRIGERFMIGLFKFLPKSWLVSMRPMSGENIAKAVIKIAQKPKDGVKIYRPQDVEI